MKPSQTPIQPDLDLNAVPKPSRALVRVLAVVQQPDHTIEQLANAIRLDVGLVVRVLGLANSAAFRRRGTAVVHVDAAIARIGEDTTVRLVMNAAADMLDVVSLPGYGFDLGGVRHRALRTAIAAEQLAASAGAKVSPALAYLTGLLSDVGKLVLAEPIAQRLPQATAFLAQGRPFVEAERTLLGADHAEVGARLAELWGLPDSLVAGIRFHHDPDGAPTDTALPWLVHLAEVVSQLSGSEGSIDGMSLHVSENWSDKISLRVDDLERLILYVRSTSEAQVRQLWSEAA